MAAQLNSMPGQDPEQRDRQAGEPGLPALRGAPEADQDAIERIVAVDGAAGLCGCVTGEDNHCHRDHKQQRDEGSGCLHDQKPSPSPVLMASRPEVTKLR